MVLTYQSLCYIIKPIEIATASLIVSQVGNSRDPERIAGSKKKGDLMSLAQYIDKEAFAKSGVIKLPFHQLSNGTCDYCGRIGDGINRVCWECIKGGNKK